MQNQDANFVFRRLTLADLPRLHEWVNRPHVAEWWDSPRTLADVIAEYGACLSEDSPVQPYIVFNGIEAVGFIQSYVVADAGDGWWESESDPGARGIDQFLANAADLNLGRGTAMVRAFMARLFADPAVTRIQTDPGPANTRAIRSYEKAGFRRIAEIQTPDGAAVLMVCTRAEWTRDADASAIGVV